MNIGVFSFIIGLIGIFLFSFILCPIALILGIIAIIQKNNILWGALGIVCAISWCFNFTNFNGFVWVRNDIWSLNNNFDKFFL